MEKSRTLPSSTTMWIELRRYMSGNHESKEEIALTNNTHEIVRDECPF
jgi:hypothetical protein